MKFNDKDGKVSALFSQWKNSPKTTPGDYIRSLVSGFPWMERRKRCLMLLQAFIDDSATTNPQQPFFALAGFISTYDNWANFSDAWQAELDKVPPIKYFKMNQAFLKKGPFKGWSTLDIEKRVARFIKIINSFAMVRVSCSMNRKDYDDYFKGWVSKEIDNPYSICFYNLIIAIFAFQRRYKWDTKMILYLMNKES